jgi:hypothetical protein
MQWWLVVAVIASTLVLSVNDIICGVPFRDVGHVRKHLVFVVQEAFTFSLRYLMSCHLLLSQL